MRDEAQCMRDEAQCMRDKEYMSIMSMRSETRVLGRGAWIPLGPHTGTNRVHFRILRPTSSPQVGESSQDYDKKESSQSDAIWDFEVITADLDSGL